MKCIISPEKYLPPNEGVSVFLAGSIEMGKATDWQRVVIEALSDEEVTILNPRRKEWDSTWVQEETNIVFNEQVTWELEGMESADIIFFYFDPETKSPVTMLELGLALARNKKCIVVCPDGFWRKGNIDITSARYGVKVLRTLEEGLSALKQLI